MEQISKVLVVALIALFVIGCGKKEEPTRPSPSSPAQEEGGFLEQAGETVSEMGESVGAALRTTVEEAKKTFTTSVDLDTSVADLRAEAAQMDLAALKETALKYKDAILEKQVDLDAITTRLTEIPMMQRLGEESKELTAEAQQLTGSLKALKERFDVYVTEIRNKGGDTGDLRL